MWFQTVDRRICKDPGSITVHLRYRLRIEVYLSNNGATCTRSHASLLARHEYGKEHEVARKTHVNYCSATRRSRQQIVLVAHRRRFEASCMLHNTMSQESTTNDIKGFGGILSCWRENRREFLYLSRWPLLIEIGSRRTALQKENEVFTELQIESGQQYHYASPNMIRILAMLSFVDPLSPAAAVPRNASCTIAVLRFCISNTRASMVFEICRDKV